MSKAVVCVELSPRTLERVILLRVSAKCRDGEAEHRCGVAVWDGCWRAVEFDELLRQGELASRGGFGGGREV